MTTGYNIILADCDSDELSDFKRGLEQSSGKEWIVESRISNWGRSSKLAELKRYFRYFSEPFSVFLRRKNYGDILGWQQFYALNYGFYCKLFHVKKRTRVTVANFTYKKKQGIAGGLYHRYMRGIVSSDYVDCLLVPSRDYIGRCASELGISEEKFRVIPFGVSDLYGSYEHVPQEEYALAIGRSNRDYDWLIEEWKGIDMPLRIISDVYTYSGSLPDHISILNSISGDQQYPQIMGSSVVIIPIKDGNLCSGDTVLLTSLSFKKPVIVTEPSTLAEMYIQHGYNGYCVKKEPGCLAKCVAEACRGGEALGNRARESYLKQYSRYSMGYRTGKLLLPRASWTDLENDP